MYDVVTFEYDELTLWGSPNQDGKDDPEPHTLNVQINLICTDPGRPATGPTYACGGEPATSIEYEVDKVYLMNPSMQPVGLSETQFTTMFPDGERIIGEAVAWACETEHE